jgi:hypothetical protein
MLASCAIQAQSIGNQIIAVIQYTGLLLFDHQSLGLDQLNIIHLQKFLSIPAAELAVILRVFNDGC